MTARTTDTAARIQMHAKHLVASAPPLTPETRAQLAEILTGGGSR